MLYSQYHIPPTPLYYEWCCYEQFNVSKILGISMVHKLSSHLKESLNLYVRTKVAKV